MPIERSQIERSLRQKGFVSQEKTKHLYFHHELNGKRSGISTFVSRGSNYRTYDNSLISAIKRHLRLDSTSDTKQVLECPMTAEQYNEKLRSKGLLQEEER